MYAGRIVAEGSPEAMKAEVEREAGRLLEVSTDQPGNALQGLEQAGFVGASLFGTKIHLLSKDPTGDETRLKVALSAKAVHVQDVTMRPLTLEDVFVHRVTVLEREEREAMSAEAV
jgi:ABC-2 type transport system ATP-binding protein